MTRFTPAAAAILALAFVLPADAADGELEAREEQAFKRAAALAAPSVVRVRTVAGLDRVGRVLTSTGPTTGIVVSADGYVISSSFNFASKPASILVELPDGRRLTAEEVATDRLRMLTLLKVEATDLVPAKPAITKDVKVGQWAIALGRTYEGPLPNVSIGIVSALGRIWGKAIQTDAKISPTNYGGPLVDVDGNVLGILVPLSTRGSGETAGVEWYDSGIGFAIPMEDALEAARRLKAGKDLLPGLMGIELRGRGVLAGTPIVDRVRVNSPAAEAGVKKGDVIVAVEGTPVFRQAAVRHVLGRKYAGDELALKLERGEETLDVTLTLTDKLVPYDAGFLGILPTREGTDEEIAGVGVRHVYADGPAAKAGLKRLDRIVGVGDQDVSDLDTLIDLVGRSRPGENVEIRYTRMDAGEQTATVTLADYPKDVPGELRSWPVPAPETEPKTGRFNERMEAQEHDFWAYVPTSYHPGHPHALMVWLHPGGDTMEAAIFKTWKPICDQRNIILVAPKAAKLAGWTANEADLVRDVVEKFREDYTIDSQRVFLHGYADGGTFALQVAFKHREHVRGVAVAASPLRSRPQEASPEFRQQFFFTVGDKDPQVAPVKQTATMLDRARFPTTIVTAPGREREYPSDEDVKQIARWADALDRL